MVSSISFIFRELRYAVTPSAQTTISSRKEEAYDETVCFSSRSSTCFRYTPLPAFSPVRPSRRLSRLSGSHRPDRSRFLSFTLPVSCVPWPEKLKSSADISSSPAPSSFPGCPSSSFPFRSGRADPPGNVLLSPDPYAAAYTGSSIYAGSRSARPASSVCMTESVSGSSGYPVPAVSALSRPGCPARSE